MLDAEFQAEKIRITAEIIENYLITNMHNAHVHNDQLSNFHYKSPTI